jgi:hypothetical protein
MYVKTPSSETFRELVQASCFYGVNRAVSMGCSILGQKRELKRQPQSHTHTHTQEGEVRNENLARIKLLIRTKRMVGRVFDMAQRGDCDFKQRYRGE